MSAATLLPTTAPESDEEAAVRETVRDIAVRCRDTRSGAADDHLACWQALFDSGFTALRDPEDDGSPAASTTLTAVVVEELAGAVCGAPLVGALLAAELRRLSGGTAPDGPATVLLSPDLSGLAGGTDGVAWDAAAPVRHALGVDDGRVVAAGLGPVAGTQDLSRPIAHPDGAPRPTGAVLDDDARGRFEDFARLMVAADLLGAAGSVLAGAVDYAGQRVQFGVPIGSFQAVQHLCAGAYAQVEALRSAVLYGAWALDTADQEATAAALVAKAYAARAGVAVAETAVQVYGGVAVTWEFTAHRHLRRTLLDAAVFGGADLSGEELLSLVERSAQEEHRGLQ
ncbi:acyl-CoA dehydrogenase [Pseudonocardia endophytica]|uniref:Alkylation response protein AidB-like acyl-CoA dehydrogenase n=1 Tax=Pseudonocardia endophytica TaxID=401976 RepID=A0A4R1HN30_PSEEN|nr:acyl-CoA dehydrogenase [Pseudonocardia endophytica]TCK21985.1 alkylation response protein AidB-like acyl-CoA dehydrogenase [Pseudonocardia endophytica]